VARYLFPATDSDRTAYVRSGNDLVAAASGTAVAGYLNAAGTSPTSDVLQEDATAFTLAEPWAVDSQSRYPRWYGPDGVTRMWISIGGGALVEVIADVRARFEAVEARVTAVEPGGASAALRASQNLTDLVSASAARTALGLGSAATTSSAAYDVAGAAAAAQAASQPLDADLTAIAALTPAGSAVVQESGGAWAARTPAQLAATLPADQAAATASLRTLGTGAAQAAAGNAAPNLHASSHASGGTDPVTPAAIGAVPTTRTITAGAGLTGGGDLGANRSFAVNPTDLGQRLRTAAARAWRANGVELGLMAAPPTITTGTSNLDGTLTKSYLTASGGTPSFRVTGGTATQCAGVFSAFLSAPVVTMPSGSGGNTAGNGATSTYQWSAEFWTDAPKVMLHNLCSSNTYMVEVDDQPVSGTGLAFPASSGSGYTLLDFTSVGGSAIRKIRVELATAAGFAGVYVGPTYTIWPPSDGGSEIRVAVVAGSIDVGTGSTLANGARPKLLGKLLGWTDVRPVAHGGTGFVAASTTNVFGDALRVADTVAANPNLVIISASQNDDASVASLAAAALAAFQAYRTALPAVPIVVTGVVAGSSGPSATRLSNEAAVKSAFDTWADSRSIWIPMCSDTTGSWETGTGTTGAPTGTGNRDRYGFDTAHPNQLGHVYLAQRAANAFRQRVLPAL
jgi:hypothetical protein